MLWDDLTFSWENGYSVDSWFRILAAEVYDESCGQKIHVDQSRVQFERACMSSMLVGGRAPSWD